MAKTGFRIALAGGLAAALLLAARRAYDRRARERVVSHQGLDDPEVAQAFSRVARLPQMRLLRWYVARRAVAMVQAGQAADLGCGPGYLVAALAQAAPGLQVTGIDLSDEMLFEAERYARRSGLCLGSASASCTSRAGGRAGSSRSPPPGRCPDPAAGRSSAATCRSRRSRIPSSTDGSEILLPPASVTWKPSTT